MVLQKMRSLAMNALRGTQQKQALTKAVNLMKKTAAVAGIASGLALTASPALARETRTMEPHYGGFLNHQGELVQEANPRQYVDELQQYHFAHQQNQLNNYRSEFNEQYHQPQFQDPSPVAALNDEQLIAVGKAKLEKRKPIVPDIQIPTEEAAAKADIQGKYGLGTCTLASGSWTKPGGMTYSVQKAYISQDANGNPVVVVAYNTKALGQNKEARQMLKYNSYPGQALTITQEREASGEEISVVRAEDGRQVEDVFADQHNCNFQNSTDNLLQAENHLREGLPRNYQNRKKA